MTKTGLAAFSLLLNLTVQDMWERQRATAKQASGIFVIYMLTAAVIGFAPLMKQFYACLFAFLGTQSVQNTQKVPITLCFENYRNFFDNLFEPLILCPFGYPCFCIGGIRTFLISGHSPKKLPAFAVCSMWI